MENQSKTPPAVPDGQVQTLETNPSNPASNGGVSVKEEVAHESSRPPFAIPQPMREEQVQNAVKFLSHPRVKGSPVIYRRSFLERKGLTKEEINEAFHRVPDPASSNAASAEATTTNQTNQVSQPGLSKTTQLQAPIQTLQPAAGGASTATILQQSRFHWKHALVAIGALAASGAGTAVLFKKMVLPGLKSWVRKVVEEDKESKEVDKLKTSLAEETVEAAKATASAAAIMAKASQELVNAKTEERKRHELLMELMDMQVKEMKSMSKTIHGLETRKKSGRHEDKLMGDYSTRNGTTNNSWMNSQVDYTDATFSSAFPKQGNGTLDVDSGAVRPTSAPASAEPLAPPPHPKSYMEIMAMIQRGEKPPGIKEINDMPPNPNQPPSKPVLAPRPKPWEIPQQTQQAPIYGHQYQSDNDPAISEVQDNSQPSQHNGKMHYASDPFWGKKTVKITEIESEADGPRKSSSLPPQRTWIPPQPPAVVMPEAAAAIRQPRSSAQKQLATNDDDVSMASSEGIENETVKTTESIVELEYPSSASMDLNQSEIQEESVNTIEV